MSRNSFNRYTTVAEKLHYLNKKRLETATSEYNIENITQSLNYRESLGLNVLEPVVSILTNPQAFIGEQTIISTNGFDVTLDSMPGYVNVPCILFYYVTKVVTVDSTGLITIENGANMYLLGKIVLQKYNGSHYIASDDIVSGTYELTVPLYAIAKNGNTLTISHNFTLTTPQEVNIYAPTLTI